MTDRSGGEPLSEELEAKIVETSDAMRHWQHYEVKRREILRAFARELLHDAEFEKGCECDSCCRLEELRVKVHLPEGSADEIAGSIGHILDGQLESLQELWPLQDQLLASQETSRQLAEARWIDEIVGLHRAMRLAILRIQRGKNIEACRTLIAALPPPPGPKMRVFLDALAAYRSSEAGRGKNGE